MGMYDENVGTVENEMTAEEARELGLSVIDLDSNMDEME